MKKRVVAVLLSLSMCMATAAEATAVSAAEFSAEIAVTEDCCFQKLYRPQRKSTIYLHICDRTHNPLSLPVFCIRTDFLCW